MLHWLGFVASQKIRESNLLSTSYFKTWSVLNKFKTDFIFSLTQEIA